MRMRIHRSEEVTAACARDSAVARLASLLIVSLLQANLPTVAMAAWPARGLAFCQGDTCQRMSASILEPDGTGGALLLWARNNDSYGLAAQRITRDGLRAPGWQPNGTRTSSVTRRRKSWPRGSSAR